LFVGKSFRMAAISSSVASVQAVFTSGQSVFWRAHASHSDMRAS